MPLTIQPIYQSVFELGFDRPDDRFIPVRAEDLAETLATDVETFGPQASGLREVAEAITEVINQEVGFFERELAHAYAPLNPDRDTIQLPKNGSGEDTGAFADVQRRLSYLLGKANFEELSDDQVIAATKAANTHGMKIKLDPSQLSDLHIWVRGHGTSPLWRRTLRSPLKGETIELPTFRRLVLVTQLWESPHLYVKLFKEIPVRDLEALLPNAKPRMGLKDMAMLIGGGGGAVWSITVKIIATGLAAAGSLLWVMAVPLAGLGWRTFSGYRRATKDRDAKRTRNLYFQSLGNNASAIHTLTTMIAQEEVKEALLIYAFCSRRQEGGEPGASTTQELDAEIEAYLTSRFGVSVNFDMPDAYETMDRFGLWEDRERLRVLPHEAAVERLEAHWRGRYSARYHMEMADALSPRTSRISESEQDSPSP